MTIDTTGDEEADAKSASQTQRTVDSQASDLRDAKSDAVDNMNKAKALLDATTVKSNTDGTVVEVNKDVSKSTTGDQPNSGSHCEQRKFTSQRGII